MQVLIQVRGQGIEFAVRVPDGIAQDMLRERYRRFATVPTTREMMNGNLPDRYEVFEARCEQLSLYGVVHVLVTVDSLERAARAFESLGGDMDYVAPSGNVSPSGVFTPAWLPPGSSEPASTQEPKQPAPDSDSFRPKPRRLVIRG